MAFIQNIETNYSQPFVIRNLSFIFENDFSTSSVGVNASYFGLEESTPLISGSFKQNKISLQWEDERPITKNAVSGFVVDNGFSGFFVNYYDINRNFLSNLEFRQK